MILCDFLALKLFGFCALRLLSGGALSGSWRSSRGVPTGKCRGRRSLRGVTSGCGLGLSVLISSGIALMAVAYQAFSYPLAAVSTPPGDV